MGKSQITIILAQISNQIKWRFWSEIRSEIPKVPLEKHMATRFYKKKSENYTKRRKLLLYVSFLNIVSFSDNHIVISKGCRIQVPNSTPISLYYWYLWYVQITNQIMINSNQIQIRSRDSKSNLLVLKLNRKVWFNRDLNQIMIWICPSLLVAQPSRVLILDHGSGTNFTARIPN